MAGILQYMTFSLQTMHCQTIIYLLRVYLLIIESL